MEERDIDHALGNEEPFDTSAGFQAQVMRAVHARAAATPKGRFSWETVWPTAAAASVLIPALLAQHLLALDEPWLLLTLCGTWAAAWSLIRDALPT